MQEDGPVVREDPEEWVGCQHGEMDDLTCAYDLCLYDRTGTTGFYSALGNSCGSEGLNIITVTLEWRWVTQI